VTAAEFPLQFAGRRGILEAYFLRGRESAGDEEAYYVTYVPTDDGRRTYDGRT